MLRLYPALVVLCVAVVAGAVALHRHVHDVLMGAVATLGYYANVWEYSAGHSTYLLQHTWTLSLEEQFYIVWPVALLLALRFRTAGFVVLGMWVAMEIADKVEPNEVLHTYVRAAGLPIGCLLARVISRERVVRVLRPLGVPCLAAIVVLACLPGDLDGIFSGWPASLAAILTVPVVVLLVGRNRVSHVLSAAPLVWIGRRSYSLYLWHFPIFTIAINQAPKTVPVPIRLLVALIGAFIAAAASYRFVEMPFLRLKKRFEPSTRSPAPEFVASHRSKP